jgi:DNA polymerase III epsilon subunit-like protein
MRVLVFDTETTGLPPMTPNRKFINPEEFRYYDGCRIIEIAYKIFDHETKTELVSFKSLVYHEGVDIKNSHIHGITNEMVKSADAISIDEMLTGFLGDMERHKVQRLVAHNLDFDFNVLLAECYRVGNINLANLLNKMDMFCTMKQGKIYMDYMKMPKLVELYDFIFHRIFRNQHRAMSDCEACFDCYKKIC